jgi:hypothetical protein
MNYTYELIKDEKFGIMIMESIDDTRNDESDDQDLDLKLKNLRFREWTFSEKTLKNNKNDYMSTERMQSYMRTREWTLINHPELLL